MITLVSASYIFSDIKRLLLQYYLETKFASYRRELNI